MDINSLDERDLVRKDLNEKPGNFKVTFRADNKRGDIFSERPFSTHPDTHPVNGNYNTPEDEDDDDAEEDDLILGDEDEAGDEEEFDVELDDDLDDADISEDDLVIDTGDDIEDEKDDDL